MTRNYLPATDVTTRKLRIGILMGGMSIEHEASFNSGRTICDHLDYTCYEALPIFQTIDGALYILPAAFLHRGKTTDFVHRLEREARTVTWDALPALIDFAFIAMHGRYAEDGALQGMLEILGIPYLGSKVLASALSMNKALQRTILQHAGIVVPRGVVVTATDVTPWQRLDAAERDRAITARCASLTLPLIVKPSGEGSSLGVTRVYAHDELWPAIHHAATITPGLVQDVVIEEKVIGMEFSCIIITDVATGELRALPPTEIVPDDAVFSYEEKYMPGRATKYTPARCSEETLRAIQQTCIDTMRALTMVTYGRIDGFVCEDGAIVIIDPNSLGGMAPATFAFVQAAEVGLTHTDLINHLLRSALAHAGIIPPGTKNTMNNTAATPRLRVGVLMGGPSAEREVSLDSGRNVVYKLSSDRYDVTPLFLTKDLAVHALSNKLLVKNSTHEIAALLTKESHIPWSDLPKHFDFIFNTLHGRPGEDGTIQGALEMLRLPYNGSGIATSALCMDKWKTNRFLEHEGFEVPRGLLITQHNVSQSHEHLVELCTSAQLNFPVVIKPHDDGCSTLVMRATTIDELHESLVRIFAAGRQYALVEEFVRGMELTVGVIGNEQPRAFVPSHAVACGGILSAEEKFLPGAGENQTPAPLDATATAFVQREIERAYTALGCRGYARIDCFYQAPDVSPTSQQRLVILEVNTLPALTPATCLFHQAAEAHMSPMELLDHIVMYGLQAHGAAGKTAHAVEASATQSHRPTVPHDEF